MNYMMKVPHVIQIKNIYHFRYTIPKDCREHFGRRSAYKISLKTNDINEAKEQAEKLANIWKAKIEKIREQHPLKDLRQSQPTDLEAIALGFKKSIAPHIEQQIHSCLSLPNAELRKTLHVSIENSIEAYRRCILKGSYTDQELINLINPFADKDQFALDACLAFEPRGIIDNDVLSYVARRLVPIILEGLETVKEAILKELYPVPLHGPHTNQASAPADSKSISEVLEQMLTAKKRATRTKEYLRANLQLLIDWRGDIPVSTITKDDILDFRDNCARKLPKHHNKKPEHRGLGLKELIKRFGEDGLTASRTVNNKLMSVIQLVNYAEENGYMNRISLKDIQLAEEDVDIERAFSLDELKAMFNLLEPDEDRPSRYWIPLLGMYSGARLNELAQLHTTDIHKTDDIWVLDLNANNPSDTLKSLKNKDSKRLIPIHPKLLEMGFVNFVEERQRQSSVAAPLFEDLTHREGHGYRSKVGHWFNNTLRPKFQIGTDGKKNFHSLRYSFIQQCQNQDDPLDDRAIMELTGHALTNAGISSVHLGYSGRLKPKALYEQISKLDYGF